ncbi:acetyltransferase [Alcaligenaceae bacterium C4P045]|nr:acetyltransferase [Alcaligenaceae bacterium C4P045]
MTTRVGIFGLSGMARDCGDIAWAHGFSPVYVVRDLSDAENYDVDVILEADVISNGDIDFVIGIGDASIRKKIFSKYFGQLNFRNLIHPGASFGRGQLASIGQSKGVIIGPGVCMSNNIAVGNFAIFNANSTVGHDCIIEDYAVISPGACISGNVHVREGAWVGASAVVNQGLNGRRLILGEGCVIGSGAVVLTDCEPGGVYVGVPAKRIK